MKTSNDPRAIVPGDIQYSKLSHTLRFTVSINEKMIMMLEQATGNNMLSPEEAALALCRIAEDALGDTLRTPTDHSPTPDCVFDEEES